MNQEYRILILDHNLEARDEISSLLIAHSQIHCALAADIKEALSLIQDTPPDLIIVHFQGLEFDQHESIKQIRRMSPLIPILALSDRDLPVDSDIDADAVADETILKPFRFANLLARLRAHLEFKELSDDAPFQVGAFMFRPVSKDLVDNEGEKIKLTEKEASILVFLQQTTDAVVTRDVLLKEVWGYNSNVTTHTLETHIYRLRQKIEPDPTHAQILVTEPGGYRLLV